MKREQNHRFLRNREYKRGESLLQTRSGSLVVLDFFLIFKFFF